MPQSRPKRQIEDRRRNPQKNLRGEERRQELRGAGFSVLPYFGGECEEDENGDNGECAMGEVNGGELILREGVELRIFADGGVSGEGEVGRDEGVLALGELGSAGDSGVVCGNPSAERDLNRQRDNGDDSPSAQV